MFTLRVKRKDNNYSLKYDTIQQVIDCIIASNIVWEMEWMEEVKDV